MSSKLLRTILPVLVLLALVGAVPAFADPAPSPEAVVTGPAECGVPVLDLFAPSAEGAQCKTAPQVAPLQPDFMVTYHGHCRCDCSVIPDCNTSADCGGAPCLGGRTCC